MPAGEPQLASARRLTLVSVFAAALWLFLVNPGAALADGDHSTHEWDSSSEHESGGWQDATEDSPPSSGYPPDHGQPPSEGTGPGEPCEEHGQPEEHPPVTPPEHTPPAPPETPETPETPEAPPDTPETPPTPPETPETPPEHTPPAPPETPETPPVPPDTPPAPPVTTPPVTTPPVTTPPVESPPVETPLEDTPTQETPSHENKPTPKPDVPESVTEHGGGLALPLEQQQGGGVVVASPTADSLPFTGSETSLLLALGIAFLGAGLVLHRVTAARD